MRRNFLVHTAYTAWLVAVLALGARAAAAAVVVAGSVAAGGEPLAGARVELVAERSNFERVRSLLDGGQPEGEPVAVGATDAAGRFALAAPAAAVGSVVVRADGFVAMRYSPLAWAGRVELPPLALQRDAGARLVLVDGGGRPADDVRVMAFAERPSRHGDGWQPAPRYGRSDGQGRLTLSRAAGESLAVHLLAPARLPVSRAGVEDAATLAFPAATASRQLAVVDEEGRPLAGVLAAGGDVGWPLGRTGDDGRLAVAGERSRSFRLHLLAGGAVAQAELTFPPAGAAPPARFVLPSAGRLRGRVVDRGSRRGVAAAVVWPGHDPGAFAVSGPGGGFELPARAAERFWIQAEADGREPRRLFVEPRADGTLPALEVELAGAAALAGLAVDAGGRPLAGVRVAATPAGAEASPRPFRLGRAASRAVSDGEGRFLLPRLAAGGAYDVEAVKDGFAPLRVRAGGAPPGPLRLVLAPARAAYGRAVDAGERPLQGVEVRLSASGAAGAADALAATGADGRFTLPALPASEVDLAARKRGFVPLTVRGLEVPPGDGPADLGALVLVPGAELRGTVEDPAGAPVPEVSVWLVEDEGQSALSFESLRRTAPDAVTDGRGEFLVADLPPRHKVHLALAREGFLSETLLGLEVPPPEALRITLERGAWVSGRVVDGDGAPVALARVSVRERQAPDGTVGASRYRPEGARTVESDAAGAFLLAGVAPGEVELQARAAGFQVPEPTLLELPVAGGVDGVELTLEPGAVIAGRVAGRRGGPVAGARMLLGELAAATADDGRYRLEGAPLGERTLHVRHRGYAWQSRELEVLPGENVADFELDGGLPVTGRVLDADGTGVVGARVELRLRDPLQRREYRAATGAEGRFEVAEVVAGRYDLEAAADGYVNAVAEDAFAVADARVDGVEIRLAAGARVSGRLLGLDYEELAVAHVAAERGERELAGTVDYEGRYEVRDLGPGSWLVKAWLRGGGRQAQARVVVAAGALRLRRDLEFGRGLTLTGRVHYAGAPLAGTRVTAEGADVAVVRQVTSDRQGAFRLDDLEPGRYRLGFNQPHELVDHYEDVELRADRDLLVEIATAGLRGRVTSVSGEPLAGAQVYVQRLLGPGGDQPGPVTAVRAGSEGGFALERAAIGRHRVAVRHEGFAPAEEVVELFAGEQRTVELALEPAAGLDLAVRLASGAVPRFAAVGIFDAGGQPLVAESRNLDADGFARFDTVPAGDWEIVVSAPGGAVTRVAVEVPGEPLAVVLPDAGRLSVRVPEMLETDRVAALTVHDAAGRLLEGLDEAGALRRQWTLAGGVAVVDGVPAGVWTLRVTAAERRWEGVAVTSGTGEVEAILE